MEEKYSIFDIVVAIFRIIIEWIVGLFKAISIAIIRFFNIPGVRYTSIIIILIICFLIVRKMWKNRGNSMYRIIN